jgi:hypothetical protein
MYENINLNDGLPLSAWSIADLRYGIECGDSIASIADFLCRSEDEVWAKAIELGLVDEDVTAG